MSTETTKTTKTTNIVDIADIPGLMRGIGVSARDAAGEHAGD